MRRALTCARLWANDCAHQWNPSLGALARLTACQRPASLAQAPEHCCPPLCAWMPSPSCPLRPAPLPPTAQALETTAALQPTAECLGAKLKLPGGPVATFSEEVVRGTPAAPLSQVLGVLDPR